MVERSADAAQQAIADLPFDASGVVVGAPGTGKTTALTDRVAALVAAGVTPDAIAVLTPSRLTATALRDRLALTVGQATSGPMARSVASFAFRLVRAAAVAAGDEPPQLLTGADEDQLIHDLLDGDAEDEQHAPTRWPDWLTPSIRSTKGFRAEVRAFIAECTTLGLEPARLAALGRAHELPVWESMASFTAEYLQVRADMRGAHRDAAGLIREAVGLVRAGGAGAQLLDPVAALLIDDAQELTLGGVELVEACRARGMAVLAFGDPDVGAGAFRGATPENFARLAAGLGGQWVLRDAHRGTPAHIDLVRRVTGHIGAVGVVAHRAAPVGVEPDASLRALTLRSSAEEYDAIARLLRERHVHAGVPWGSCAVIAHDTRQISALEAELSAREVPARASGPGQALGALAPVRDLLRLIELAASDDDWTADDVSGALGGVCGRLDPIELRRLRSGLRHSELAAGGERAGRELLVSAMRFPLEFDLLDTREARRAATLARTLEVLRRELAEGATVHELLWTAWDRSHLERAWTELAAGHGPLAEQAGRDLDAVVALFQAAKRFVERTVDSDPRAFVRGVLDSDVADDRLDAALPDAAVRVLTPAGAIGTEFDTVVIAGVQDGVWPNTRLRGSLLETWRLAGAAVAGEGEALAPLDRRRAAMHDELRLLVRAASRATTQLIVTAVDDDDTGPSVFFEFLPDPEPFTSEHPLSLRGLVAAHRRTLTSGRASARPHAAGQLALLADAGVAGSRPVEWYGVPGPTSTGPLRDLAREDIRVSPSRLHTLEECELNWVIGDLGGDAGSASAGLGTIIHAALEHAEGADEAALWRAVEARWGELTFEAPWRERAELTRARDLIRRLHAYLRDFERSGGSLLTAEPHFEVAVPLTTEEVFEHGVVLSGYIDRVELTPEGAVVIIDLKTGKREPQSDAKVADNPQLAAYQLAFEAGAIEAAAGHPAGGARLLVLRPTSQKDYVIPHQPPFDDDTRAAFVDRISAAVGVMRGSGFQAPYEEHCRADHSYGLCRIHTIGAVSAS
ncbi:ATP-dependent helicase [Microbacterium terricola]|uniref:DNA 3'-5' helicase n=1 Tax=Microbacterium terricola TaxID=344163 RepID=A0ABM8DZ73_9MICO|nr:ATP-dependent DNA helicase [Microbacterium terricola]UYK41234.1 ATP-dependent helicase [Microbacterium terricola]BDV30988.1 DNA helicase [Microbacterium terricola]